MIFICIQRELTIADNLVNRELKSKNLLAQWTNRFLAESGSITLDPITFAFTRFCLNVALCYLDVPPSHFLKAKVHEQLVGYIHFNSELVTGMYLENSFLFCHFK